MVKKLKYLLSFHGKVFVGGVRVTGGRSSRDNTYTKLGVKLSFERRGGVGEMF